MPPERDPSPKRLRLGVALRAERERTGMTTRQFAAAMGEGWSQSKVSSHETGRRRASAADIDKWAATAGTGSDRLAELLAMAEDADVEARTWEDIFADRGIGGNQEDLAALDRAATHIAVYQTTLIPGLAQTAEYARRVYELLGKTPEQVAEGAGGRIERQSVLYAPDKRIDLVLTEATLWLRIGPVEVMHAQLEKLINIATLPTVTLGVVPLDAPVVEIPQTTFALRQFPDGTGMVTIELIPRNAVLRGPEDVARYLQALDRYMSTALTGDAAADLIREVSERHG